MRDSTDNGHAPTQVPKENNKTHCHNHATIRSMKKKMMKKFHLLLLLTAMFSLPVTLTSCGDDDDDDNVSITIPTGTATNLTMERVVGTWKRIHSSGKEIKNGRVTKQWDKNVERDQDHFVFYADGRCLLLDYEDDQRLWEVEERASFSIQTDSPRSRAARSTTYASFPVPTMRWSSFTLSMTTETPTM